MALLVYPKMRNVAISVKGQCSCKQREILVELFDGEMFDRDLYFSQKIDCANIVHETDAMSSFHESLNLIIVT